MARKEPREASAREFMEAQYALAALDRSGLDQDTKDSIVREGILPCKDPGPDCARDRRSR